jgi:hypothetical protein
MKRCNSFKPVNDDEESTEVLAAITFRIATSHQVWIKCDVVESSFPNKHLSFTDT